MTWRSGRRGNHRTWRGCRQIGSTWQWWKALFWYKVWRLPLLAPGLIEKAELFFLKLFICVWVFGPQHVLVAHCWLVYVLICLTLMSKIAILRSKLRSRKIGLTLSCRSQLSAKGASFVRRGVSATSLAPSSSAWSGPPCLSARRWSPCLLASRTRGWRSTLWSIFEMIRWW